MAFLQYLPTIPADHVSSEGLHMLNFSIGAILAIANHSPPQFSVLRPPMGMTYLPPTILIQDVLRLAHLVSL